MTNSLSTHNNIVELYEADPIPTKSGGLRCPVCKKEYKRESALKTHMEKMDCYKLGDVFRNTVYEEDALEMFSAISEKKMPLFIFRKSTLYTSVLRFVVFCYSSEIKVLGTYYSYVAAMVKRENPNYILKAATSSDKFIKPYREFLQSNPDEIGKEFLEQYRERLLEDELFLVRSIEKSHVSVLDVIEDEELADVVDDLPSDYFIRVEKIYQGAV